MTARWWRGRRVLVTGHTGFKGAWLCHWLHALGAEVSGLALPAPTEPSLFARARIADRVASVIGDIRDAALCHQALERARPEVVLHLGAEAIVRRCFAHPIDAFSTNVMGTVHVLEALRHTSSVRAAVIVTTDKCYENSGGERALREDDRLGGTDPYGASKACAELATHAYRASYLAEGPFVATARAGNVIGGGDWAACRLLPDCVRAFAAGEPVAIRHPEALRPWQHVLESLAGYLTLAERLCEDGAACAQAWNFGPDPDDAWPVSRVVERACAAWGEGAAWAANPDPGGAPEAKTLRLDARRARARLGWHPRTRVATAIDWTVGWARAHAAGADAAALCDADLARFDALETRPGAP